jgi:hypothetical protein
MAFKRQGQLVKIGYIFSDLMTGVFRGDSSHTTPLLAFLSNFAIAAVGTGSLSTAVNKTDGIWVHHGIHGSC